MARRVFLATIPMAFLGWGLPQVLAETQPAAVPPAATAPATEPAKPVVHTVDFARDIKPILSDNCFACHGPDANKRKADLRLDTKDGFLKPIDGVAPIVPFKPDEGSLFSRIHTDDPDDLMPQPKSGKKKLSDEKIALIRKWIEEGAEWKDHWAYVPPVRPETPPVANEADTAFVHNPIDNFVLAHLAGSGLTHAPEADRATLIRRLSLDVDGLPPTPEEVDAFVNDQSPNAYEKVVDRLLASPRFGERMAVSWLDLVRYADTVGLHGDQPREVWPYRDWVINAFNNNMRFDQFTIDQLAGDLLPNPTRDQRLASAYNRLLLTSAEGGVQAKEYIARYGVDRVRNFSTVWMGATVGCANCHDHKFDPYTQKDFFRMEAFFADIKEQPIQLPQPELALPTPEQDAALAKNAGDSAAVQQVLATTTPEISAAQQSWEQEYFANKDQTPWKPLTIEEAKSDKGSSLTIGQDKLAVLAGGAAPDTDTYTIKATTSLKGITAIRLEALTHPSLPSNGPGRAGNGNFVLSELDVTVHYPDGSKADHPLAFTAASASIEQTGFAEASPYRKWPASAAIDGDKFGPTFGWAILDAQKKAGRPANAVFETAYDLGDGQPIELIISLKQNLGSSHLLGNFRFAVTDAKRPVHATQDLGIPIDVVQILDTPTEKRNEPQKVQLATYFRTIYPGLQPARDQLTKLQLEAAAVNAAIPRCLTSISGPPRVTRVLPRGDWQNETGEIVTPGVPGFMKQANVPIERGATRLDLANWVVDRENPLTARVFVNRLWKMYYGQGLARPLDDLGSQGDWPTHPKMLDWMAVEFMDSGWDIKHMVKLMVMSGAYRQSSTFTPDVLEKDPYNHLLARQTSFRMDAEFVRDNALAISGLIVETVGGPSVKPYQPARYWEFLNFPKREYDQSAGDGLYRRGLYTWWQRMFLNPSLLNFDASSREECVAERTRSNTPQQALTLMNDPTYVEAARVFAAKIASSGCPDDASKINWAFKRAIARTPSAEESQVLAELLTKHRTHYAADKDDAAKILKVGEAPAPKDADVVELASWTSVARTILNLHETITRD